ncbi:MAG: hypothetical protein J6S94_04005 [Bacteroidaceae bacterium]|nr:hypothetical protein [Bacteroidaceae bacterium]
MEENKEKRVLRMELDDAVKKVSITCMDKEENVVMKQVLDEEDLDMAVGGNPGPRIVGVVVKGGRPSMSEGVIATCQNLH